MAYFRPQTVKLKKKGRLKIHEHQIVKLEEVPQGWQLKGYDSYVIQDLVIRANNISYDREVWVSPDGKDRLTNAQQLPQLSLIMQQKATMAKASLCPLG